jgi:parallel beta-helix repeat protein
MKKALVIGIILLFVGASVASGVQIKSSNNSQPLNRGWLYVGGSGPGNYTSIQSAIDSASDGDTVFVYDDSSPYYERLLVNEKSIKLVGEDSDTTIIELLLVGECIYVRGGGSINISGFTLRAGNERGMFFFQSNNNIISDNIIIGDTGIGFQFSNDNTITNNVITSTNLEYGLRFHDSSKNNIITNNSFFNSGLLFEVLVKINDNFVYNNTINGKPLVYLENESNKIINNAGQIILVCCDNITIQNQEFSNISRAIFLSETNNSRITDNTISHSTGGVQLLYSSNNNISSNIITHYRMGITLDNCDYNKISYNTLIDSLGAGIFLAQDSEFNHVFMNLLYMNDMSQMQNYTGPGTGVGASGYSDSNNFSYNTINTWGEGISITHSNNNSVYMNNITNCIYGILITGYNETNSLNNRDRPPNVVKNNNFRRNIFGALSRFITNFKDTWIGNYWNRPKVLPKIILGIHDKNIFPIRLEFDLHPAQKPYDIPRITI